MTMKLSCSIRHRRDALNTRKLAAPHVESSYAAEGRALRELETHCVRAAFGDAESETLCATLTGQPVHGKLTSDLVWNTYSDALPAKFLRGREKLNKFVWICRASY